MDKRGFMPSFIILALLFSATLNSQDFGTFGSTYPIQEQNILEYLHERLLNSTQEERELITKKQIRALQEPAALNLPNSTRYRCFYFDPTIVVKEDIRDHEGKLIVKKGTRYNPLENNVLNNDLLFFDATQESHLMWVKRSAGLWILVKGKPLQLEEQEKHPVYFDQFGYLTSKFGIKAIPAKVSQEGKRLKVEEFVLEVSK